MSTQRYSVTPQPIDTLLAWVKSGEIAIPEIQRPFVWEKQINIAIGDKDPKNYFKELAEQCAGGSKKYGGITKRKEMEENFLMSCLPVELLDGGFTDYDEFLKERRKLMAQKIKTWFNSL